jgi:hypothetical protein
MSASRQHSSLDANSTMGFHGLKQFFKTREYLREYCEYLTSEVGHAAEVTRQGAKKCLRSAKDKAYLDLKRRPGASLGHAEVQLERAMFWKWLSQNGSEECGWHRIIDFQVPVKDRLRSPLGLKAIDLLGIDTNGLPIIIELKIVRQGKGADTPLLALLEAASYACILQADWPSFKNQLEPKLKLLGINAQLPESLKKTPLVVAGPPEYWKFWTNPARASIIKAKTAFLSLVQAFDSEGLPICFTCVEGSIEKPDQLTAKKAPFLEDM